MKLTKERIAEITTNCDHDWRHSELAKGAHKLLEDLEAKERECEQLKATASERVEETRKTEKTLNNEFENSKSLTAQLIKVQERLNKLVNLVWTTRWVSEEEDYQKLLGIAAAIRSGNYEPIDAMAKGEGKA
jgi:septal ring factor EnvC (AmiA/AmiB activator)